MPRKPNTFQEILEMGNEEQERMLQIVEKEAREGEERYWGCSQVVLGVLQRNLRIGNEDVFKAATGFAGGVAGYRETCGALIGGIMAIGLVYGRDKYKAGKVAHEQLGFLETRERAIKLCEQFKERFGSLSCADVRNTVGRIPLGDDKHYYTLAGIQNHDKCGEVTSKTARLTTEIILEPSESFPTDIEARIKDLKRVREQQKTP